VAGPVLPEEVEPPCFPALGQDPGPAIIPLRQGFYTRLKPPSDQAFLRGKLGHATALSQN